MGWTPGPGLHSRALSQGCGNLCVVMLVGGSGDFSLTLAVVAECPDQNPELQPWNPGHDEDHEVHIGQGRMLLLTSSATVHSIRISEGGEQPPRLLPTPTPVPCRREAGCRDSGLTGQTSGAGVHGHV